MQKNWKLLKDETGATNVTVTFTQDLGSDYDAYVGIITPTVAASGLCELKGIDSLLAEFQIYSKTGIVSNGNDLFASIGKDVKTTAINNMRSMPTTFPLKWVAVPGAGGQIRLRVYGIKSE